MKNLLLAFISIISLNAFTQGDDCSGAVTLTVGTTCTTTGFSNNENGQPETGTPNPSCLSGTESSDVWYSFIGDGTTLQVAVSNLTESATVAVWTNCPATTQVACMNATTSNAMSFATTLGTTYYVQIIRTSGGSTTNQSGDICISKPGYTMTNGSISACSGTFYDSGGSSGNYGYNESYVYTICPGTPGAKVRVNFTSFDIEDSYEFLEVFDGNSVAAPSLGVYTGTTGPGIAQATPGNASGCLTFRFTSDNLFNYAGWVATISCITPCQSITANLVSTNEAAGAGGIIRICQGESVNFVGSGTFGTSGAGATYTWNMGNGATVNGANINYTWPAVGSYLVNLTITDPSGCTNSNSINQQVQISTTPTISTSATPSTLCTNQVSNLSANVTMNPYTVNCTPPVSGTTFLPDGSGVSYTTSITTNCYQPGLTVTSATDITNVCLNMEHSFLGDLDIRLICPNGQSISLKDYPGGSGTYLGAALDDGTTNPGTGATYCFTPGASTLLVNGSTVMAGSPSSSSIAPGNYMPVQSFSNLIGCPLNGSWTIQVTDHLAIDNGYIFNWDINFSAALMTASSFTPTIVSQGWVPAATLTSTGATTAQVVPTSTGSPCFNYSVTDNFGCTYTQPQCITVNCTSLPVGLTSFEASAISNERVLLTWETSSETNSDYFNIERSIDGESGWELIATVDAAGNSAEALDYQTYDNDPYNGTSYYRLHQYDLNGMLAVTDLEAVYLDFGGESGLILFPNPSKSLVSVKGDLVALSTFEVLNAMGQNVRGQIKMFPQADGSLVMDISELSAGVYMVKNGSKVTSLIKE